MCIEQQKIFKKALTHPRNSFHMYKQVDDESGSHKICPCPRILCVDVTVDAVGVVKTTFSSSKIAGGDMGLTAAAPVTAVELS